MTSRQLTVLGILAIIVGVPTHASNHTQVPSGALTVVVFDLAGDGIKLSPKSGGVSFAIRAGGNAQQVGWTLPGSDDSFLTFDANHNGRIDSVAEMVGSQLTIDSKPVRDGVWALMFPLQGVTPGPDGRPPMPLKPGMSTLSPEDPLFVDLRLWQDLNHDGVPTPLEVKRLSSLDIAAIGLGFQRYPNGRPDSNGNLWFYEGWFLVKKRGVEFRHGFGEIELAH